MKKDTEHRAWRENNIVVNDSPEIQKSAIQTGMYSPLKFLKKQKNLLKKKG
jgi:hypothetical protein